MLAETRRYVQEVAQFAERLRKARGNANDFNGLAVMVDMLSGDSITNARHVVC